MVIPSNAVFRIRDDTLSRLCSTTFTFCRETHISIKFIASHSVNISTEFSAKPTLALSVVATAHSLIPKGRKVQLAEVTCYLLIIWLKSEASSADIGPEAIQPVLKRINRWSVDNLLRESIPFTNRSLTEEVFSTVESASVDI